MKKFVIITAFFLFFLLLVHNYYSKPGYFGLIHLDKKEDKQGQYMFTFHKVGDTEKVTLDLSDSKILIRNEEVIPIAESWKDIKEDNTYHISMEQNRFPYNKIFDTHTIEVFYMD
ncbi:hypothetical protein GT022_12805 [Agaribacter marinus]|uniref:Uncharacterized protein n=1 Tax=Virgibacillus salarius TaxID=447199 RepID=A0A941I9M4_9BACI|nr:hypothetical protein [Virgibacillus salarius]MBR7796924.1 hypothetical protein [Virgibacillus salarius]NAZ09634.1 hypothetical protein [Agaribacter marinus]